MFSGARQRGFTLIELVVATALAAMILLGVSELLTKAVGTEEIVSERNALVREARFALQRIERAVTDTNDLLLPQIDKPDTDWRENVREETVPASSPEGSSTKATAVLAVALGPSVDLDGNGVPDADNDGDGRLNEDPPADATNDSAPGVRNIDDGGDGRVDEGFFADRDDDERLNVSDEDPVNGIDDDGDGAIDEDAGADLNGDGEPGIAGIDDDGDSVIDEGNSADDDEDGLDDEDWLDAVVFYLDGDTLVERHPVPWDESEDGSITGRDFVTNTIADQVTRFSVERVATAAGQVQVVSVTLELAGSTDETVVLSTHVRVGSKL